MKGIGNTKAQLTDEVRSLRQKIAELEARVTAGKLAEGKLKESEEGYRKLIETSPYTIFVHIDQKIVFMNPAGLELLGAHNSSEVIGKSIFDLTHPDYLEVVKRRQALLKKGDVPLNEYFKAIRLDGSVVDCEISTARRVTYQGKAAIMSTIRDVTDRMKAEAKLQQYLENLEVVVEQRTNELSTVNKELEAFSYSVAHDLRAPLRNIDGFSQALLEDYPDKLDEQGKNYLNRVRSATQRMVVLIDDLLSLSRVKRSEMRHETVDLSVLAQSIAEELQETQPDRQVAFVIAPGLTTSGDAQLLRLLMENLLGNAWKFTGKHPKARIEFGVTQINDKNTFFIRDDGAGFDMAYADKLFEVFQRLHAGDEFSGTGVGLATVQRVAHRHSGRVWAEGEVEKGTTFYFQLD